MLSPQTQKTADHQAVLALWAIPGVGPKGLEGLRARFSGDLGQLLTSPIKEWCGESGLTQACRDRLASFGSLAELCERVDERVRQGQMQVVYQGEPAFPQNLAEVPGAPPLLFFQGAVDAPKRRLAMVGSRHPDSGFLKRAEQLAEEVAAAGAGVVSGAAEGVDRACHVGCMKAGQPTWAFLGSALDEMDSGQKAFVPSVLDQGGAIYSELPPGVRASTSTFPRRNRLISGASDAVLVLRASQKSGSLHTAEFALEQGRPLLALPGENWNPAAEGCNTLISEGKARLCRGLTDVCDALRLKPRSKDAMGVVVGSRMELALSEGAREALEALSKAPKSFDEVLSACQLTSADLTSALCELELSGLAIQHPGRRYERI